MPAYPFSSPLSFQVSRNRPPRSGGPTLGRFQDTALQVFTNNAPLPRQHVIYYISRSPITRRPRHLPRLSILEKRVVHPHVHHFACL